MDAFTKPFTQQEPLPEAAIDAAIAETKAESLRDLGAVMGALKSRYRGRMDFCRAGAEVRSHLT